MKQQPKAPFVLSSPATIAELKTKLWNKCSDLTKYIDMASFSNGFTDDPLDVTSKQITLFNLLHLQQHVQVLIECTTFSETHRKCEDLKQSYIRKLLVLLCIEREFNQPYMLNLITDQITRFMQVGNNNCYNVDSLYEKAEVLSPESMKAYYKNMDVNIVNLENLKSFEKAVVSVFVDFFSAFKNSYAIFKSALTLVVSNINLKDKLLYNSVLQAIKFEIDGIYMGTQFCDHHYLINH